MPQKAVGSVFAQTQMILWFGKDDIVTTDMLTEYNH